MRMRYLEDLADESPWTTVIMVLNLCQSHIRQDTMGKGHRILFIQSFIRHTLHNGFASKHNTNKGLIYIHTRIGSITK